MIDMIDLGLMQYFIKTSDCIFISQKKYVLEFLDKFRMKDCNSVCTLTEFSLKLLKDERKKIDAILYKQIVGSLMYLTQLDLTSCIVLVWLVDS